MANLSRFAQCTWIDLSEHRGMAPVEMLGRARFPLIGDGGYCLTLGPYAFYWFQLAAHGAAQPSESAAPPTLTVAGAGPADWVNVFRGKARIALEEALPAYLQGQPWFQGRFRALSSVAVRDAIVVPRAGGAVRVALVQAEYAEGDPELYVVPLAFAAGEAPAGAVVAARLRVAPRGDGEATAGALYDPCGERVFVSELLDAAIWGGEFEGEAGDLNGCPTPASAQTPPEGPGADAPPALHEGDNTTASLDGRALLKLYRRVEEGSHPEVEMLRFLAAHSALKQTPALLGVLEYQPESGSAMTTGMAQEFIAGEADAGRLTLDALHRFFERVLTGGLTPPEVEAGPRNIVDLSEGEIPEQAREMLGAYLETARLMARRTAELHVALASDPTDAAFAPEPFTPMYQRSLYQSMRGQIRQALERLRRRRHELPEALRESADRVLQGEEALLRQARRMLDRLTAVRIRCHGDYQLKHLVSIGHDFLVVDFDGEPDRPLSHRRRKRSPVRDLTSLHRSLQDAAEAALAGGGLRAEDVPTLRPWARFWRRWASVAFLKEYRAAPGTADLLPHDPAELRLLFDFYRLGWNVFALLRELDRPSEKRSLAIQNMLQMLERT